MTFNQKIKIVIVVFLLLFSSLGLIIFVKKPYNYRSASEIIGNIHGTVSLGPTCPVMRDPPDPQCADKPYQARLVLTSTDGAYVIKEFNSDKNGEFNIEVPPGEYSIRTADAKNILPRCSTNGTIKVDMSSSVEVVVYCDTGIR